MRRGGGPARAPAACPAGAGGAGGEGGAGWAKGSSPTERSRGASSHVERGGQREKASGIPPSQTTTAAAPTATASFARRGFTSAIAGWVPSAPRGERAK